MADGSWQLVYDGDCIDQEMMHSTNVRESTEWKRRRPTREKSSTMGAQSMTYGKLCRNEAVGKSDRGPEIHHFLIIFFPVVFTGRLSKDVFERQTATRRLFSVSFCGSYRQNYHLNRKGKTPCKTNEIVSKHG